MRHIDTLLRLLALCPGLCDACIADRMEITRRQAVYKLCNDHPDIRREMSECVACDRFLNVRSLHARALTRTASKAPVAKIPNYLREEDLQARFNETVISALRLGDADYYSRLTFEELLRLKSGLARINDIVTLKLTVALVDRIGKRLKVSRDVLDRIHLSVRELHPNAAGFDVDSQEPNVIGEVKSCIPVNAGATFGAAQLKGLTNDVLQMFGHPATGKQEDKLSQRAKIRRPNRTNAIKFLALYDSPSVREATEKWKRGLLKSNAWKPLEAFSLKELPEKGPLSPKIVYLTYLKPLPSPSISMPPNPHAAPRNYLKQVE